MSGFTLVEIAIVMMVVGLLIGGVFGGMRLVENAQINRTIRDLKAIETAVLAFRDGYGRLPGDLPNPSARLPDCTAAPCATGGNGNRRYDRTASWDEAIGAADERYTLWHHLRAAGLIDMAVRNSTDMSFGAGSPDTPLGGGYRVAVTNGPFLMPNTRAMDGAVLLVGIADPSSAFDINEVATLRCETVGAIDAKIDDGLSYDGRLQSWCGTGGGRDDGYDVGACLTESCLVIGVYDLKGF